MQKILKPPEGAYTRIHQPPFPKIDPQQVETVIKDGLAKNNLKNMYVRSGQKREAGRAIYVWFLVFFVRLSSLKTALPRIVPVGPPISSIGDSNSVSNSARRLEVRDARLSDGSVDALINCSGSILRRFCVTA